MLFLASFPPTLRRLQLNQGGQKHLIALWCLALISVRIWQDPVPSGEYGGRAHFIARMSTVPLRRLLALQLCKVNDGDESGGAYCQLSHTPTELK